jgi:3-oxoacyl-[acyl-carrier protein] reductase
MQLGLNDRIILVTGAGRGIGAGIALAFAQEGARVILNDVNQEHIEEHARKIKREGGLGEAVVADISHRHSVQRMVDSIVDRYGRLDVLVNNAGILRRGFVEEIEESDWNITLEVNLKGVLNCCQAVIGTMKRQRWGKIINGASIIAKIPDVGLGAYAVSKSGVVTITKILAAELAPYNINVNAYLPGVVETPMTEHLISQRGEEKLKYIALRRFAQPRDIANLCLFLASDVSSYITGAAIDISGGNLLVQRPWVSFERAASENRTEQTEQP